MSAFPIARGVQKGRNSSRLWGVLVENQERGAAIKATKKKHIIFYTIQCCTRI